VDQTTTEKLTVWLDEQAKIASFHSEDGYREKTFPNRDAFIEFLHSLQQQGYRFL